jgi:methylase of polypeptide subunit release factors
MALSSGAAAALARLRDALEASGYCAMLAQYGIEIPRSQARALDRLLMPEPLASLVGFLESGDWLPEPALAGLWAADVDALVREGFLAVAPHGVRLAELRLVPHAGLVILCDAPTLSATAYHGEDSLALARLALRPRPGARVLDLCSGVGSQGLLLASGGAEVIAVEINPRLRDLQAANAVLNPVVGTIEFRTGDLYEAVEGWRFDAIFANPPLVPVPEAFAFALPNNGGPSGLDLTRRIAQGVPEALKQGGDVVLQGVSFGDADGPRLDGVIDVLEACGCGGVLTCFYREALADRGPMMRTIVRSVAELNGRGENEVAEAYRASAGAGGDSHLHSWQLFARRNDRAAGRIARFPVHVRNGQLWLC